MADLPWGEFLKRVGGTATVEMQTPPATDTATVETGPTAATPGFESLSGGEAGTGLSLLPPTDEAVTRAETERALAQGARAAKVESSSWDFISQLGARPGVPFDSKSGLPFISRLASEREPTEEEKVLALQGEYGKENVRLNKFGQPVVSTVDKNGKAVDILANPLGLDPSDLATLFAETPALAGSVIPLLLTRGATLGPGVLKALGTLGLTTGGAELGGAVKDMFRRWVEGRDVQAGEVAGRHAWSGATGLMFGAGLAAGGFAAGRFISPFSSPGRLNFLAQDAQKMFKEKYGIDLPMTAGEKTGSPILQAGEALEGQQPGSRTAFSRFKQKQLDEINRLRGIATGAVNDEEAMGKRIVETAKEKLAPLEFDVELAAQEAQKEAAEAIKTGVGVPVNKTAVGNALDLRAKAKKAEFDAVNKANYDLFYNNPKAKDRIIGGAPLKKAVDDLIADLPAVEKDVQVPTGLVGANNQPIFTTATEKIPVTTPVRARLEEISQKLEGGRLSINDLKQIRTDVDNAIKTGEAVPGVKEGRLKTYYSRLSEAIDKGLKDINDPALTKAWEDASGYYKTEVGKFEKAGINEMFRDPSNALGPSELVDRALQSPDTYDAYKSFFGADSPEIKGVHQAAKDWVLNLGNLGKTVDAAEFARRLEQLDARSPELLKDAFGGNAGMLRNEALAMLKAQGQQIPKEELDRALASGTLSSDHLRDMITAESRRTEAYANGLVKELSQGTVKPDRIRPTEVVDKFVFRRETQPEHLSELMGVLNDRPEVQEDLRRLTFKRVLDDATVTGRNGERVLAPTDLDNVLADPNLSKKLKTVLGESSFEDLVGFRDFLKAGQSAQEVFRGAGGLAGNTLLNRLLGHGELAAIPQFVKNFALATVYTSEPIKKLLSNTVLQQEGKALAVNTAIASAPWIRALTETFTKETAREVQTLVKGKVDQLVHRDPASAQPGVSAGTGDIPWDQFLQRVGGR